MEKFVLITVLTVGLSACANIAEQALLDGAESQVVNSQYAIGKVGIYRIWKNKNGNMYGYPLCEVDTKEMRAFQTLPHTAKTTAGKLVDQDAFDNFQLTISPVTVEESYKNFSAKAGITFNGVPRSKRVAENVSVSSYALSTENDELLDDNYVMNGVGADCEAAIKNESKYKTHGKPVFIYAVASGKRVYSKIVGLPSATIAPAFRGTGVGELKIASSGEVIYAEASDAPFGFRYFAIGPQKASAIPVIERR